MEVEIIPSEKLHRDTVKKNKKLPAYLPKPPFLMVVQGCAGSGKSSFTWSLVNAYQKRKYFDVILIWNRCSDSNHAWLKLENNKTNVDIFSHYDDEELFKIIEGIDEIQSTRREQKKAPYNILMLFDDMVMSNITGRGAGKPTALDEMIINRRHHNVSLIITSQNYKALSPNARTNNLNMLVLLRAGDRDKKLIHEEHNSGEISYDEFDTLQRHIKERDPYGQMVIDQTCPQIEMFKDGFNRIITPRYIENKLKKKNKPSNKKDE